MCSSRFSVSEEGSFRGRVWLSLLALEILSFTASTESELNRGFSAVRVSATRGSFVPGFTSSGLFLAAFCRLRLLSLWGSAYRA